MDMNGPRGHLCIDHFTFGVWSIDDITAKHEKGAWFVKSRARMTKKSMEGAFFRPFFLQI